MSNHPSDNHVAGEWPEVVLRRFTPEEFRDESRARLAVALPSLEASFKERVRERLWALAKEREQQGDAAPPGPGKDLLWAEAAAIREAATKALAPEADRG